MGFFNFYRNYANALRLEEVFADLENEKRTSEMLRLRNTNDRERYSKEITRLQEKLNEPTPAIFSKGQRIGDLKIRRVKVRTKTEKFKNSVLTGASGIVSFLSQKKGTTLSDRLKKVEEETLVRSRLRWNKSNWNYEVLNVITGARTIYSELHLLEILIQKINKYEQTDKQKATD